MAEDSLHGVSFKRCRACDAVWIAAPGLLSLLREEQPWADLDELLVHNDGSTRDDCPVCTEQMEIAWIVLLPLQQCAEHGVFCAPGVFERAMRYEVGQETIDAAQSAAAQREAARKKRNE